VAEPLVGDLPASLDQAVDGLAGEGAELWLVRLFGFRDRRIE
jgi:hypothetical protein